jgi:hypothetical protein
MAATGLNKYKVSWFGPVGPAWSTFYQDASGVQNFNTHLRTFFEAIKTLLHSGWKWQYVTSVDQIDPYTGNLTGTITKATGADTVGGDVSTPFAVGAGVLVTWKTGVIVDGRRLSGRTFLVPLSAYDNTGLISSSAVATIQGAANTLITNCATELQCWHRPRDAYTDKHGVAHPARLGAAFPITAATVTSAGTTLRSRRT